MARRRPVAGSLVWLFLLFLLAALITLAAFWVLIPGPQRGLGYYVALSIVVAAEFLVFAHLASLKLAGAGAATSGAARIQVQVLIFVWFVVSVIAAAVVAPTEEKDLFFADRVLLIYAILTFVFFLVAYFVYSKDIELKRVDTEVASERRTVQAQAPDVSAAIAATVSVGRRYPDCAVAADRLRRKLDTLRTTLASALVSERSSHEEAANWGSQVDAQAKLLTELAQKAAQAPAEDVPGALDAVDTQADSMLRSLERHTQSLTS